MLPLPDTVVGAKLTGEPAPGEGVTVMLTQFALIAPAGYPVPGMEMFAPTSSALAGDVSET